MFIIWGFGKTTLKKYGKKGKETCGRCSNHIERELIKVTTWFTLFFIPIIPYRKEYYLICPICQAGEAISKADFNDLKEELGGKEGTGPVIGDVQEHDRLDPEKQSVDRPRAYGKKTDTQRAYLEEMEKLRQEKNN